MISLFFRFITSFNFDSILVGDYICLESEKMKCENISFKKLDVIKNSYQTRIFNRDILIKINDTSMSGCIIDNGEVINFRVEKNYPFLFTNIRFNKRTLQINLGSLSVIHAIYFNGTDVNSFMFKKQVRFGDKIFMIKEFKIRMFIIFILVPMILIFIIKKLEKYSLYKQRNKNVINK